MTDLWSKRNFQAEGFAPMILGITQLPSMLVRIILSKKGNKVGSYVKMWSYRAKNLESGRPKVTKKLEKVPKSNQNGQKLTKVPDFVKKGIDFAKFEHP